MPSRLRNFFLLLTVLGLICSTAANADAPTLQADWVMSSPNPDVKSNGIVFMEPTIYPGSVSYLRNMSGQNQTISSYCNNLTDTACLNATDIDYSAYIPKCKDELDVNCIDDFWVLYKGVKYQPTLQSYFPDRFETSYTGDSQNNLPTGIAPSIWKLDSFDGSAQASYFAINPLMTGQFSRKDSKTLTRIRNDVQVTIDPVVLEYGGFRPPFFDTRINNWSLTGCLSLGCQGPQTGVCAAIGPGVCAKRLNNPEGVSYGISLRLSEPPTSWIHGRMSDQTFELQKLPTHTRWTVSGSPMVLPVTSAWISAQEYSSKLGRITSENSSNASWSGPYNAGSFAMNEYKAWEPFLGDKAQALQSRWSFRTIKSSETYNGKTIESCSDSNRVIGLVSTNAMVYQGEPPQWNSKLESLDYKLAAPHFQPNGEEFLGRYNLRIDENIARCIYGFDAAPLRASISIVSSDGSSRVATTTFTRLDNWLIFNVDGFTFSAPTISIKLEKEVVATPTPTPTPTPTVTKSAQAAPIKTTLKCRKGKSVKTITAVKPKCPSGYIKVK